MYAKHSLRKTRGAAFPPGMVYLIGLRASGKTTVGRDLAQALGWEFMDADLELESAQGLTIAEIVAQLGWNFFRRQESIVLDELHGPCLIIATGGGAILAEQNRTLMRSRGLCVYLRADPATLALRLQGEPLAMRRPPLTSALTHQAELEELLQQRQALYEETAHVVLDAALPVRDLTLAIMAIMDGNQGYCQTTVLQSQ